MKRVLTANAMLGLGLMAGPTLAADDEKALLDQCLAQAKAAREEAAEAGGLWRDVDKMLKQAEKTAADRDLKLALRMCKDAEIQGRLGYEQAKAPVVIPPAVKPN
jgi:hypothetical protein